MLLFCRIYTIILSICFSSFLVLQPQLFLFPNIQPYAYNLLMFFICMVYFSPCFFLFCLGSMHSFFNFGNFISFHFIYLFFVASCNIFTLIFSSISLFCLFQVCIRCLSSSHPYYSFLICFSNPYFSSSIVINLILNDLTSKPFRLTITIA